MSYPGNTTAGRTKGKSVPTIEKLEVDLFRLPLPVAMGAAAAGVMTAFDMVTARITDSDGVTGVGTP